MWPAVDLFRKGGLILQRLKSRRQFQAVLAASTLARTPHFALHCAALDAADLQSTEPALFSPCDVWLGAMVPKRWAKRAVTRNTIKRQIYTLGLDFEHALRQAAHVVRLRSGFDRTLFPSASSAALKATVRSELQQLFAKAAARPLSG